MGKDNQLTSLLLYQNTNLPQLLPLPTFHNTKPRSDSYKRPRSWNKWPLLLCYFDLCFYLFTDDRRIICKPSILPLGLAVSKAGVYEQTILSRHWEALDYSQHLIPETLQEPHLTRGAFFMVESTVVPKPTRISWFWSYAALYLIITNLVMWA